MKFKNIALSLLLALAMGTGLVEAAGCCKSSCTSCPSTSCTTPSCGSCGTCRTGCC